MRKIEFHWVENTWTFYNKKQVPVSINKESEFFFIDSINEINNKDDVYFVTIKENNSSKKNLFNEYYEKFKFPYFGFNWDALLDCMRDLDWIEQRNIVVYHEKLPELNRDDLKIYLYILRNAIGDWKKWEEHDFEVYFNVRDYDSVQQIIE
jgi:hypothetical protein